MVQWYIGLLSQRIQPHHCALCASKLETSPACMTTVSAVFTGREQQHHRIGYGENHGGRSATRVCERLTASRLERRTCTWYCVQPPNPLLRLLLILVALNQSLCLRGIPKVSAQLVSLNSDKGSDEKWHLKEPVSRGVLPEFIRAFFMGRVEGSDSIWLTGISVFSSY